MGTDLTKERIGQIQSNLLKYYKYSEKEIAGVATADLDTEAITRAFRHYINDSRHEREITDTLNALSHIVITLPLSIYHMVSDMIRPDLLKLFLLLHDESNHTAWLSLRTPDGTVRLKNYCNWFLDGMVKDYLRMHLHDIQDTGQAEAELAKRKHHPGRIPNDPQLLQILWGTYKLLRDKCTFKTPMPNRLCQFLLTYLQIIGIIHKNTDIDTFWIRAQLRYIRTKEEKKSNPA